jgi:hypothetical protein
MTPDENKPSKLKSFITRHSRLLQFLGALIVFTTFIVKEGLRDQLKDLISATDTAQNTFTLRNDIAASRADLTQFSSLMLPWMARNEASSQTAGAAGRRPMTADEATDSTTLLEMRSEMDQYEATFNNAAALLDGLPETVPEKQADRDGLKELEEKLKQLRAEAIDFDFAVLANKPYDHDRLHGLSVDIQLFSLEVHSLERAVRQTARDAREKMERKYKHYNYGSYALYALGWGLGLLGRLLGVGGVGGEG